MLVNNENDLDALYKEWLEWSSAVKTHTSKEPHANQANFEDTLSKSLDEAFKNKAEELKQRDSSSQAVSYAPLEKEYPTLQTLIEEDLSVIENEADLEAFRVRWIGRQGAFAKLTQAFKEYSLEEKKRIGPIFNALKASVAEAFAHKEQEFEQRRRDDQALRFSNFDVTAYQLPDFEGSLHPYTHVIEQIEDIFISMGFEIADGPEVETDFYNFEALNIPKDHPARDMQDTFWLTLPGLLMRTHTSSVEIRAMSTRKPPLALVVPGRAYRNEATDASHDFMFMQLEGLFVDKGVSLAHLFATMKSFLQAFFEKKDIIIKTRPSYFPFVEPGVEIDMSCPFCTTGCSVCKRTRWIEICGAGLCHPAVLEACSIDPKEYGGFAFGFGLTRLVMLKYGITDIRLLHSNKIDFLKQF